MQFDSKRKNDLISFQKKLNIKFKNIQLLNQALTHSSFITEPNHHSLKNNERLEFLGDSVLGLIINEYLYKNLSEAPESKLSLLKSYLVSQSVLSEISQKLDIGNYLSLGKGELQTGGRVRKSNLSNALEAIIGAYYLDKGLEKTKKFVLNIFQDKLNEVISSQKALKDYKSILQEYSQKEYKTLPTYVLEKEEGPEHQKIFTIAVYIKDHKYAQGVGRSKRESELQAAKKTLEMLKII